MDIKKELKIFQWNSKSILNKQHNLIDVIQDYDIALINETWLSEDIKNFNIPNFHIIRKDRSVNRQNIGGGVLIALKKNIPFIPFPNVLYLKGLLETVAIKIPLLSNSHKYLSIVAFYRPPNQTLSKLNWLKFFDSIIDSESVCVIGGDANAHSSMWDNSLSCINQNSCCSCQTGFNLLETITENDVDLIIANNGTPTYINSALGNVRLSALDLTFVSSSIFLDSTWSIHNDLLGSDHWPINIKLNINLKKVPFVSTHKLNTDKLDWNRYNRYILNKILNDYPDPNIFYRRSPEDQYEYLNNTLIESVIRVKNSGNSNSRYFVNINNDCKSLKKSFKEVKKMPPWWSDECTELVKWRRSVANNLFNNPSLENLEEYLIVIQVVKKKLKEIKTKSFHSYVEKNLNRESNINEVWNVIKKFKNRLCNNNNKSSGNDLTATKNMHHFIENYCALSVRPPPIQKRRYHDEISSLDEPFSMDELDISINSLKTKSSPGLDKISNEMILHTPYNFKKLLLHTLNIIFQTEFFPTQWSDTLIILLPKDNSNTKFRPIALTSCISKLMGRLILLRLQHHFEKNNLFTESQNGFRKGKSCTHSLSSLVTNILNNFSQDKPLCAVLIDIRSAFDNVIPSKLQNILIHFNIPLFVRSFINKIMVNKSLFFKISDELHGPYTRDVGVPQGRVLSPLLYNIYIIFLSSTLNNSNEILQFADDTIIFNRNLAANEGVISLQENLISINSFLEEYGLPIAPEKTNLIVFDRSKHADPLAYKIIFQDKVIISSDSVKYLGMTLDSKLSWKKHTKIIIEKCKKLLNVIKVLRGTWWGGHPQVLLNVYKGLIRSVIEYNIFLMNNFNDKTFDKLNKIQNSAIRLAMGCRISTPIRVLHAESGIPTLLNRLKYLADNFIVKLISYEDHQILCLLSALHINTRNSEKGRKLVKLYYPLTSYLYWLRHGAFLVKKFSNAVPFQYNYETLICMNKIKTDLHSGICIQKADSPDQEFKKIFQNEDYKDKILFFTDGSKFEEDKCVGSAIYCPNLDIRIKYKLHPLASIFTAEAFAILNALKIINDNNIKNSIILTDSQSVLAAVVSYTPLNISSYLIYEIRKYITTNNFETVIAWIPSHRGVEGNEIVDSLAKDAVKSGEDTDIFLPATDLKSKVKQLLKNRHFNYLENTDKEKGLYYFNNFFKKNMNTWFKNSSYTRRHITIVIRLRSNHHSLMESLEKT